MTKRHNFLIFTKKDCDIEEVLICSKDGKDIKWGLEYIDSAVWCKAVLHKGEKIAEFFLHSLKEQSLKSGYTIRKIKIDKNEVDKYWDEFTKLGPEEQIEKEIWEKENAEIKRKEKLREKYDHEFQMWLIKKDEERFEEFLKENPEFATKGCKGEGKEDHALSWIKYQK